MLMYPGTLVNEIDMGCNLEALLIYDHDLFANMVVPDGVDKLNVISAIRRKHGLAPLYHPDPGWMKNELLWWSKENLPIWKKLFATTKLDYNPIWNTDVSERTTDQTTRARSTADNSTSLSNGGTFENSQHSEKADGWNTADGSYHEKTKSTSGTQTEGNSHEGSKGTSNTVTAGTLHETTNGTSHSEGEGTVKTGVVGTSLTTTSEEMTDQVNQTKNTSQIHHGVTVSELSAENEAGYQPDNRSTTDSTDTGRDTTSTTETRSTTGTSTTNTSSDTDTKTTDKNDTHTTGETNQETHGTSDTNTTGQVDGHTTGTSNTQTTGQTDGSTHSAGKYGDTGDSHDTTEGKHHDRADQWATGKEDETVTYNHGWTKQGNIGVTSTQQLIEAERQVVLFNIYDIIADSFHKTFCLDVY